MMKTTTMNTAEHYPASHSGADLFCGAGGTSTGLLEACEALGLNLRLVAVNHSTIAIRTHSINHPDVKHVCDDIENADPLTLVPSGRLLILVASPECIHFSNARGGRPMNDQSRSSVSYVLRWARALHIEHLLIENVEEFTKWGPLYPDDYKDEAKRGRPIPERKGEFFHAFLDELRALGYTLDWRIVNTADHGDATTRKRFFLLAKRGLGDNSITWPAPTHAPRQSAQAKGLKPWVPARDIIDWSLPGTSIYGRKTPLKPNTLRRIYAGLSKFCGLEFVIGQQSCAAPRSVDEPIPTVATAGAISFVQPYIVHFRNHSDARSLDEPVPTLTAGGQHVGLAQPFLVGAGGPAFAGEPQSVENPVGTVLTKNSRCLVEPYLMVNRTHATPLGLDEPLRTLTTGGNMSLVQPYVMNMAHSTEGDDRRCYDTERPIPTVTGNSLLCLVDPYLVKYHGSHQGKSDGDGRSLAVDDPVPTLDTSNRVGLVQPYLVSYYGTGGALSLGDPLDTVTTRDRFGLVDPRFIGREEMDGGEEDGEFIGLLDIRFRMLQPHELAAAHSFPPEYYFFGKQDLKVKQVGNSVPVRTARALCLELLKGTRK